MEVGLFLNRVTHRELLGFQVYSSDDDGDDDDNVLFTAAAAGAMVETVHSRKKSAGIFRSTGVNTSAA